MWTEMVRFADLISSILGIGASIILGWPAWTAVRSKKDFEAATRLQEAATDPDTRNALGRLRDLAANDQLSGSRSSRRINAFGFGLLLLSFGFLMIASIDRAGQPRSNALEQSGAEAS